MNLTFQQTSSSATLWVWRIIRVLPGGRGHPDCYVVSSDTTGARGGGLYRMLETKQNKKMIKKTENSTCSFLEMANARTLSSLAPLGRSVGEHHQMARGQMWALHSAFCWHGWNRPQVLILCFLPSFCVLDWSTVVIV